MESRVILRRRLRRIVRAVLRILMTREEFKRCSRRIVLCSVSARKVNKSIRLSFARRKRNWSEEHAMRRASVHLVSLHCGVIHRYKITFYLSNCRNHQKGEHSTRRCTRDFNDSPRNSIIAKNRKKIHASSWVTFLIQVLSLRHLESLCIASYCSTKKLELTIERILFEQKISKI